MRDDRDPAVSPVFTLLLLPVVPAHTPPSSWHTWYTAPRFHCTARSWQRLARCPLDIRHGYDKRDL